MNFKSWTTAAAIAIVAVAAPAQASTVLFQDNFNTDRASSALNFTGLLNWSVSDGTIDYIRSGDFGINCVAGSGGCIDMDGSTGNAGRLTSLSAFSLSGTETYFIEALVSGNQRLTSGSDSIIVGLIDVATNSVVQSATYGGIVPGDPFTLRQLVATGYSGSFRMFFEGVGGDNVGVILDDVVLRTAGTVPTPGTSALAALALLAALGVRRRAAR